MTTIAAVSGVQETQASGNKKTVKKDNNPTLTQPLGAGDDFQSNKKGQMPKLTPVIYEIKDGDSFMKIANELGLKMTDLVEQLKDSGKLDKDYDPYAKHDKDPAFMKKGNKLKLSYPATQEQQDAYNAYTEARKTEYYNKKAAAEKQAKQEAHQQRVADYEALPWYEKLFADRP